MSHLIMECHAAYAVALDEEGRFVRIPNLGYEVGQRVDDAVVFDTEAEVLSFEARPARRTRGRLAAIVALAACLCVAAIGGAAVWSIPIGTVRMSINPDVRMDVNRFDRVVGLEGENDDGVELVDGFGYYGRTVDEVSDDLALLAEERGYLTGGGTIELAVESDDDTWRTATEDRLIIEIEVRLEHRVVVTAPGATSSGEASGGEVDDDWDDDDADDDDDWDDEDDDDDDDAVTSTISVPSTSPVASDDDDDDDWEDGSDDGDDWDDDQDDDAGWYSYQSDDGWNDDSGYDDWDDDSDDDWDDDWDDDDSDDDD